jgi:hypothetical protein
MAGNAIVASTVAERARPKRGFDDVDPVPGVTVLRGPGSVHGIDSLAGGHPFHEAIDLHPDIIDCRFLEIVRGRPVYNRTGLHVVVDRGAPNRQRHTDD